MAAKKEKPIGYVTHFYDKISVAIIKLGASIKLGDTLKFQGRKGEFIQPVTSMQFDHKAIEKAGKGKEIGMKVDQEVKEGDVVFKAKL